MARDTAGRARPVAPWTLVGAALVLTLLRVTATGEETSEFLYPTATALTSTAAWLAVRRTHPHAPRIAALVAGSASAWAVAGLASLVREWFGSSSLPTYLPDLIFLVSYGLLLAALATVLFRGHRGASATHQGGAGFDALIDALTIVTVVLIVLWNVSVNPVATDETYDLWTRLWLVAYPILDGITLALAGRALVGTHTRGRFALWVFLAGVCWLLGDLSYAVERDARTADTILAVTGMLGACFIALAAGSPLPAGGRPAPSATSRRIVAGQLAMANLPLVVPTALLAANRVDATDVDSWPTIVGFAVLMVLSFTRTGHLLLRQGRTLEELASARDVALEASHAKSTLVATVSHEIRTPMNGVIGLTDLLLATQLDERQRQFAEGVHGAGEHLLTVINEVLDFSRGEAGKLELEDIDFGVAEALDRACSLAADPAARKGVELIGFCAPNVPAAFRGDPTRLTQALVNLVGNAVKFTDEGAVVVSVHLVGRTTNGAVLRFEVRDTGPGISEAEQRRLFQPFSQANSATTRRFGGTGLGLAISRQLVAAMGGDIAVSSQLGSGSTFWFTVPLQLAHDTTPGEAAPEPLHRERVLVVTGNTTSGVVRQQQLVGWGLRADLAHEPDEALRRMREAVRASDPYRIVLTALRFPGPDGRELARAIDADPSLEASVFLLLTRTEATEVGDTPRGVTATLMKPVPSAHLLQTIRAQLDGSVSPGPVVGERPSVPAASTPSAVTGQSSPGGAPGRGRVLIVDDAEINQIVAEAMVEKLGFTAVIAEDGEQALHLLEDQRFDAVLMDCQMPVLDGFETTRRLRETEGATRRTPVIALTGSVSGQERERCINAGMDDYLMKPISPGALEKAFARWVPVHSA